LIRPGFLSPFVVSSKIARQRFMLALVGVAAFEMEVRWAQPGEWR